MGFTKFVHLESSVGSADELYKRIERLFGVGRSGPWRIEIKAYGAAATAGPNATGAGGGGSGPGSGPGSAGLGGGGSTASLALSSPASTSATAPASTPLSASGSASGGLGLPVSSQGGAQKARKLTLVKNQDHAEKVLVFTAAEETPDGGSAASGAANETLVVEADKEYEVFLTMMKGVYQVKKLIRIEGVRFDVGDFVVRVGSVVTAQQPRGIAVEVEYKPCVSILEPIPLIDEFLQNIVPGISVLPVDFNTMRFPSEHFSPAHSAFYLLMVLSKSRIY